MDILNQPPSPQPAVEQTPVPPKPPFDSKTLLIALIVFIVLMIGLTIYLLAARTKPTSQPTLSQPSPTSDLNNKSRKQDSCGIIKEPRDRAGCYLQLAPKKGDVGICENIEWLSYREWCYREMAISTKNVSLCDKIQEDADTKQQCYFYTFKAIQDINLCENLYVPDKDWC